MNNRSYYYRAVVRDWAERDVERRPSYPIRPTPEDRERISGLMRYAEDERIRLISQVKRWKVLACVYAAGLLVMTAGYLIRVYGGSQ